jgi:hypothetical protein
MDNREIVNKLIVGYNIDRDWERIRNYETLLPGTNAGNQIVDYFTLYERLNAHKKGKPSFYEFVSMFGIYEETQYIDNLITFCDETGRYLENDVKRMKYIYNIAIKSINIFKPIRMIEILDRYKCTVGLLDPTMGWGGRLVGSAVKNVPCYIGIDSNKRLKLGYDGLTQFIRSKSNIEIKLYFEDALNHDFSQHKYDMVVTSLPYYDTEIYNDEQSIVTNEEFYRPLVTRTYEHLSINGHYILNISDKIYEFIRTVIGDATEYYPFEKRNRICPVTKKDNKYRENIYIWKKT